MDYKAEAERCYSVITDLLGEEKDWGPVFKSSKDHVVHRKESEHFSGYVYKCAYTVEISLDDLLDLTLPRCMGGHIEDVDSMVKEIQCLEQVSEVPQISIIRGVSNPVVMGLISSREFIDICYVKRFEENNNKVAVITSGVEYDVPLTPKLVRAKRYPSGFIVNVVEQGDKQVLEIKQIEQRDFSGSVPSSVVEKFITSELCNQATTYKKSLKKLEKIRNK
ncbi:stAR-related lipid transfer protein 4-like [Antedon mediterranea]|uniref:stAR-related lipid transfer protein 4-like n=1 Tax=Antedon mediterranea TaxID=105859 RepID=UPI003AF62773